MYLQKAIRLVFSDRWSERGVNRDIEPSLKSLLVCTMYDYDKFQNKLGCYVAYGKRTFREETLIQHGLRVLM